jgi:hypothetical protein
MQYENQHFDWPSLRAYPFPDAMLSDELSLLKTNDKVEVKGRLSGTYTFVAIKNGKVILNDQKGLVNSFWLEDIGASPYQTQDEMKLWNGSNYIVSNKKKE